ncbi:MAG TPA: hypothetical protein VG125_26430 [Pirellulales bacterium]|jgi:hypothetical protein|nr:hypothetical protein [Pirellulales bacterium]
MALRAPNEGKFSSNKAANSYNPLSRSASPVNPPNDAAGDRRGGTASLAGGMSPVKPPNARLKDGDTGATPHAGAAMQPGKGAVPVNPFGVSGGIVPAERMGDDAATERLANR